MAGRLIPDERDILRLGYRHNDFVQRRRVLRETVEAFSSADPPDQYRALAEANLQRWQDELKTEILHGQVRVIAGDWGEVTHALTKRYGVCFAVLNMANAHVPGGAYVEGAPAQEENMFRRTDCHFHVGEEEYDASMDRYRPEMTRLISAAEGRVYLDSDCPRTCIRGPEDRSREDLGYAWLPDDEVFPFFEMRAAAQDLRDGSVFDREEARRRIAAQLDTLLDQDIPYAVLGASGCGAFMNPPREIAQIYKEEFLKRRTRFFLIAFAIFAAGYGPDNYRPFAETFQDVGGRGW